MHILSKASKSAELKHLYEDIVDLRMEISYPFLLKVHQDCAEGIDAVIFGHSHKYAEQMIDGRLWLNPGSCGKRRFDQEITLAILTINGKELSVEKIIIPVKQ